MTNFKKDAFAEIDTEVALLGDKVRDFVLDHVVYLAEREMLPEIAVSMGDEPHTIYLQDYGGGPDTPIDTSQPGDYGFINGLYLHREPTPEGWGGPMTDLLLSMSGLYKCRSYAGKSFQVGGRDTAYRGFNFDTSKKVIAHWPSREPVTPQIWLENRHVIADKLARISDTTQRNERNSLKTRLKLY